MVSEDMPDTVALTIDTPPIRFDPVFVARIILLLRMIPPIVLEVAVAFEMLPFDATTKTFVLVAVLRKVQDWLEDWNVVEPVVESNWKPVEVIYEPYPEDIEKVPAGTLMLK